MPKTSRRTDIAEVVVVVPVLNRPERVGPLADSFDASLVKVKARLLFVACSEDRGEVEALWAAGVDTLVIEGQRLPGDYARKINEGAAFTREPWLFLGADDLRFHRGWAEAALTVARETGKRVVGTADLGNPSVLRGRHSTHSLVARSYIEERGTIDQPGIVLHEGYDHQYVDNEFVETAKARDEWAFAGESVVEHLHPHWGKGEHDSTYALAVAQSRLDHRRFVRRRNLWIERTRRMRGS